MNNMKKELIMKHFEDEHKKYNALIDNGTELIDTLNEAQYKRKCLECNIAMEDNSLPMNERGQRCKGFKCQKVARAYQKVNENFVAIESEEKNYASEVFEYLSPEKPVLIRRKTGEEVAWMDAFGDKFEKIDPKLYGSLVALIEESGGKYRLLAPGKPISS